MKKLSPREAEIQRLSKEEGLNGPQICTKLGFSKNTLKYHRKNINRKLHPTGGRVGRPSKHKFKVGKEIGKLTVIERVPRYRCLVRCSCEHKTIFLVHSYDLGHKNVTECKVCRRFPEQKLIGKKIGYITVISSAERLLTDRGQVIPQYLCHCHRCERDFVARADRLKAVRSYACQCKNPFMIGELRRNYWRSLQKSAEARELSFEIKPENAWNKFLQQERRCALTGLLLTLEPGSGSVDRIDSSLGYLPSNIQWVHKVVNLMKRAMSDAEFVRWCRSVADHHRMAA